MADAEIEAALTEVPGIGAWTARGFLIPVLDRPDVLIAGDLELRRAVEGGTDSTTFRPRTRWPPWRSAGDRTGALR